MLGILYNCNNLLVSILLQFHFEQRFYNPCNIISSTYKEVGKWEEVGDGESGQPETG